MLLFLRLLQLPLDDYRNTPPPPYPGDTTIDRMSGDENDRSMRRISDSYFIASPRVTITTTTTNNNNNNNNASTSNSPSGAGTATSELQSPSGGENSSSRSPLFQDTFDSMVMSSRPINRRSEAATPSDGSRRSSIGTLHSWPLLE
jgi:hypothetical protein